MNLFIALLYSGILVISAVAVLIMHKVQPESTALYLVWVYFIDILIFLFLFFYTLNVSSQTV